MHKYIINLKRRKDRLKKFKKTSPFKFEEIQVFKGFDGLHPNNNEYGLNEYKIISEHSQMKEGEKGCFISHLNIWRDMVKNDIEYALIMEDDPIFCKDFLNKFNKVLENAPEKYDILYIGGRFWPDYYMKNCIKINDVIVKHLYPPWIPLDHDRCTESYIININLAKLFIKYFESLQIWNKNIPAVDHFMTTILIKHNINIYNSYPLLCNGIRNSPDSDIQFTERL